MNVQASAPTYNIHYNAEEDRLLISIDVPPDREFAMSLTRRLAKHLVGTLAAVHAKRREAVTPARLPATPFSASSIKPRSAPPSPAVTRARTCRPRR